jgi:hypothetical protein
MARPTFVLRVQAEPGVEVIRSLRGWLKQGLREFGLRCLDIRQENKTQKEAPMPIDLNDAKPDELLSSGVYYLEITVVPGRDGEGGYLRRAKNMRSLMLELIYKVVGGERAGFKIWDYITVDLDETDDPVNLPPIVPDKLSNFRTSVRMGRVKVRAIVDSAYGLLPNDDSDDARAKRKLNSYGELHGLKFYGQVEQRPGRNGYGPRNYVDFVITPDLPDYPQQSTQPTNAVVSLKRAAPFDDEIPFGPNFD